MQQAVVAIAGWQSIDLQLIGLGNLLIQRAVVVIAGWQLVGPMHHTRVVAVVDNVPAKSVVTSLLDCFERAVAVVHAAPKAAVECWVLGMAI